MLHRFFLFCCLVAFWSFSGAEAARHLMRQLTYCHTVMMDAALELELDGQELWHVNYADYTARRRLPESAADWPLKRDLQSQAHYSIGTCFYNVPNCIKGENHPPESTAPPNSLLYAKREVKIGVQNTLVCLVTDFHPPPVNISWSRNGAAVSEPDVSETQYYSNLDFTFRVFSYLDFSPSQGDIYACTVKHKDLEQGITRFWEMENSGDPQEFETTVLVVGIIVGFIGLAAGIILMVMIRLEMPVVI